jgi:NAD(P)H-flavin reductase
MLVFSLNYVKAMKGEIAKLNWLSEESLEMKLKLEESVEFGVGQFVNLQYRGTTRSFTVCNHEPGDVLELFIRMKPGGEISGKLKGAKAGEAVEVKGPFAEADFKDNKLLCIGGGSGMAAFVALVRAVEQGLDKEVVFFISARRLAEVGFRKELEGLEKSKVVITLTREEREGYPTGRINREFIEKHVKPGDYSIFICGPEKFTLAIGEALKEFKPHLMRW